MSISIYTTADEVFNKVTRLFPGETINKDDIYEWCMDAEINKISDGDLFAKYIDIPVVIDKTLNIGALPCNVKRIIDVYDADENYVEYQITATNHIKIKGSHSKVLLTYLGLSLDDEGLPRILSSHVSALLTYCKMQIIEPKVLMGKFSPNLFQKYEMQFSNQVTAVKQSAVNKDKKHYDDVQVIRFNMLKKVGQQRLFKNMFA